MRWSARVGISSVGYTKEGLPLWIGFVSTLGYIGGLQPVGGLINSLKLTRKALRHDLQIETEIRATAACQRSPKTNHLGSLQNQPL